MKKRRIAVIFIIALLLSIILFVLIKKKIDKKKEIERIKNARIEVVLSENLTASFLSEKKVSDFIISINGEIVDDYIVETNSLGKKNIAFEFINDEGIKVPYHYEIEVKDMTPPTILLGGSYRVKKGSSKKFINNILCGDDYDSNPKCEIVGDYNLNKEGTYPVTFKATDSSGNISEKKFNLVVYIPKSGGGTSTTKSTRTDFQDIIKEHKKENTKIGVDISKWQGDIDFDALKKAGVEFAIIRVGTTNGKDGEYILDPKFKQNIEGANRVGIDVGLYFYSYAYSKESALRDAEWVIRQIKGYKVSLPIAFDWEEWSTFNNFHISFHELTSTADTFLNRLEEEGYKGSLYSSKYYLENIWLKHRYQVWLAHYTTKTDYKGDYSMWQLCSNGKVDGIKGNVDIDILYLDKNN